jgi:prepilin-type N-terminal cleavage/methylation domain-containing protein
MVRRSNGAARDRHAREQGLTLIELTVSLAILAIIAGAIAAAFSVGLRVIAKGGPQDRLAGAHDLASLEQVLGRDGSRAACIKALGAAVYGHATCASTFNQVGGCSTANSLCFAWPQFDTSAWSCHVASYSQISATVGGMVTRTEFSGTSPISTIPETVDTVTVATTVGPSDAVTVSDGTPSPPYSWLRSLHITIRATGVSKQQFSQALTLHPVASDPGGGAAGSGPC